MGCTNCEGIGNTLLVLYIMSNIPLLGIIFGRRQVLRLLCAYVRSNEKYTLWYEHLFVMAHFGLIQTFTLENCFHEMSLSSRAHYSLLYVCIEAFVHQTFLVTWRDGTFSNRQHLYYESTV